MKSKIFIAFIVILAITGCKKNEEELHRVSGYIYVRNQPITNASVKIDGMIQYNAKSNSEGYFQIDNVPDGKHTLKASKNNPDSSFIEMSYDIDVYNDLNLDSILLPNPVTIESCSLDSTTNDVTLSWTRSVASDFREYKIYSHNTSGLDETTGMLEHIATDINDTTFTLKIASGTKIFYRVFVMNGFGRLGGSNIQTITGYNVNILPGGDFENESLFFSSWQITGNVYIIDSLKHNGNKCLLFKSNIVANPFQSAICVINSPQILVEKNVEYEISFWYKARGLAHMMYPLNFWYVQDGQEFSWVNFGDNEFKGTWVEESPVRKLDGVEWTYYSIPFIPGNNTAITFYLTGSIDELYIDKLQIKKKL